jgi:hypothetical protein
MRNRDAPGTHINISCIGKWLARSLLMGVFVLFSSFGNGIRELGRDQRIIALPGIDCRLLWTPAEHLQPALFMLSLGEETRSPDHKRLFSSF